jgi:hypothetical protein
VERKGLCWQLSKFEEKHYQHESEKLVLLSPHPAYHPNKVRNNEGLTHQQL